VGEKKRRRTGPRGKAHKKKSSLSWKKALKVLQGDDGGRPRPEGDLQKKKKGRVPLLKTAGDSKKIAISTEKI